MERTRRRAARGLDIAAPLIEAWRPGADTDDADAPVGMAMGDDLGAAAPPEGEAQPGAAPPAEGYVDVRHEFTPPAQPFRAGDGLAVAIGAPPLARCRPRPPNGSSPSAALCRLRAAAPG